MEAELNEVKNPSDFILNGAKKQLMENDFKYGWNHPQFNRLKAKQPVLTLEISTNIRVQATCISLSRKIYSQAKPFNDIL